MLIMINNSLNLQEKKSCLGHFLPSFLANREDEKETESNCLRIGQACFTCQSLPLLHISSASYIIIFLLFLLLPPPRICITGEQIQHIYCRKMEVLILSFLVFSLVISTTQALETNCEPVKCNSGADGITFPFIEKTRQPESCGRHGFELFCSENSTMIHFPSCGNLVVKSISYGTRRLDLLHPGNCVHQVFLNLNLTTTPFEYYYVLKNYTYLNCSLPVFSGSSEEVRCLSGDGYHVYTVEPSLDFPDSCRKIKTVPIPFAYSSFLADNSFGLGLTWDLHGFEESEWKGQLALHPKTGSFRVTQVGIVIIVVLAAASLASLKVHSYAKKLTWQGKVENQLEKLLGSV